MILFNSLTFLFRFFPIFLAIYFLTPARFREVVLFFGSIIFYAMGGLRMAMGLTVLTVINYILGQMVFSADKGGAKPANKRAFYAAIAIDAGSLILFKVLSGLSDKVVNEFFTEVELFCETQVEGHRDLKKNEAIVAKELFYNNADQKQIEKLEHLLEQDNFVGIQSRLGEMGMRNGFNIILYGGPGTGKTETTMQLAKKTGRDVLCIDVSALKSKWVGDSEKLVKEVFISYRRLCKTRAVKPILFFNEADAIFGKRIENVDSPAAQTLNSVQNIILQEMETIDGIMICTTNLHGNLDPAFERRFIYKVELGKPDETVRTKIWKSMLKGLNDEDYNVVAHKYPFSGGEIENVVRKATIDYILNGQAVTLDSVCNLCDEEMFRNKVRKVGF